MRKAPERNLRGRKVSDSLPSDSERLGKESTALPVTSFRWGERKKIYFTQGVEWEGPLNSWDLHQIDTDESWPWKAESLWQRYAATK